MRHRRRAHGCGRCSIADLRVYETPDELGAALAAEILETYAGANGSFLLGCPGGRSLRTTYAALARARANLGSLVLVMMDEYVEESGEPAAPDAHYSCRGFALRELARPLAVAAERVWLPDPADPSAYDERIEAAGGVDLFLLASGASDGHVAFVPPGSRLDGRTSVVRLAESTRRDNLTTFPTFDSLDDVPAHGVSVGLGTIRGARRVRLVLHGEDKRAAAARLLERESFDPDWPASVVHACRDAAILVDRSAFP